MTSCGRGLNAATHASVRQRRISLVIEHKCSRQPSALPGWRDGGKWGMKLGVYQTVSKE